MGYELLAGNLSSRVVLKPETLKRIAALGATVAFSCYREDGSESGATPKVSPAVPFGNSRAGGAIL